MNKEQTIKNLNEAIAASQKIVDFNKQALVNFMASPECNVFDSLEHAEGAITDKFESEAFEACEGAYNFGAHEYTQVFSVGNKQYEASVKFEYNRHNKMYYYIDGTDYSYVELN
jgi:hypothetical protein